MRFNLFSYACLCYKVHHETFEDVDKNNDDKITLNEFHTYFLKKYGRPPTNDQWFKFHLADVNNNGYISRFDADHFERNTKLFQ